MLKTLLCISTLATGGIGTVIAMCLFKTKAKSKNMQLLATAGLAITLIPMIHITHSLTLDRTIRINQIEFRSHNWPAQLDGYRIAFMTDFHIIPHSATRDIAAVLNEKDIDLLLLGGDFSMTDSHYRGTIREIAQVHTTHGIFGVEGNHDDYARVFNAKEHYGIIPLDNSGQRISEGLYLGGVQDMWNRTPNIDKAIAGAFPGDFVLLVSHNPDVSMIQYTGGVDLLLAGHTHSGQVTFFGFPIYLLRGSITSYGTRFSRGFAYSADGVPVFTSSGVGVYYTIPRVFSRPEVVIFTMYSK